MAAAGRIAQNPEVIARLESEAARRPRTFRLRLALIAVAGDFVLLGTRVLPWAAPILIGMFLINLTLFYWLGGVAILLFAWMLRPTFRFSGRELRPDEAPRLYAEIAALKKRLRAPGRMGVYLDGSFNASAAETRGLFGILGTRSALTLGVPLLAALTRQQVLAVVAHEFGHFSRRHGRLENWLYRARVGWILYSEQVTDSDSSFRRAAAWYAAQFVPFFSARSFVHSRQCEYEADADSALACGSKSVAAALTRIAVLSHLWEEHLPRRVAAWQLALPQPPDDYYQRFASLCRECPAADLQAWLERELRAPSGWLDTHPSLSERLGSLKESPNLASDGDCAGESLLQDAWPQVLTEFNAKWAREGQSVWLLEHLRLKHIAHPLLAADAATARAWDEDTQLARARALRAADPPAGLAALRDLHDRNPAHKRTQFAYAAALLKESDDNGVRLLEALAREDPRFRAEAFARVLAYFERKGETRQIERRSEWLKRAVEHLFEAIDACVPSVEAGKARPSSMPDAGKALIAEATSLDPCIAGHWLLEGDAQLTYAKDRPAVPVIVHVLAVAIVPKAAARLEEDEDAIARRYQDLLRTLIPQDQVPVVRTYFTTENMPAIYK